MRVRYKFKSFYSSLFISTELWIFYEDKSNSNAINGNGSVCSDNGFKCVSIHKQNKRESLLTLFYISKGFTLYFMVEYLASFRLIFFSSSSFLTQFFTTSNYVSTRSLLFFWQNKWEKHKLSEIELLVETVKCIASQRKIQMPSILIFLFLFLSLPLSVLISFSVVSLKAVESLHHEIMGEIKRKQKIKWNKALNAKSNSHWSWKQNIVFIFIKCFLNFLHFLLIVIWGYVCLQHFHSWYLAIA